MFQEVFDNYIKSNVFKHNITFEENYIIVNFLKDKQVIATVSASNDLDDVVSFFDTSVLTQYDCNKIENLALSLVKQINRK